jgi:outer membrane protein assembly factor BamD
MHALRKSLVVVLAVLALGGCFRSFNVRNYPSAQSLYAAGRAQYAKEKYANAILAFERLTFDLPTRDTLLPLAHWYLGQSRRLNEERLLAAQSFNRLAEQFPNDTLADDAMFMAAQSYREMWRRPSLDPQYGILAQAQYRLVQGVFPDSPFADSSLKALAELDEWFAAKDFETGMHYFRRRAYDSSILYFRDVVANYPNTDKARQAMLQMVRVYRLPALNYKEDAAEICEALLAGFPTDADVVKACKLPAADSTAAVSG